MTLGNVFLAIPLVALDVWCCSLGPDLAALTVDNPRLAWASGPGLQHVVGAQGPVSLQLSEGGERPSVNSVFVVKSGKESPFSYFRIFPN